MARAAQAQAWLDSFQKVAGSRDELRLKTFEWNLAQGKQALESDRTYLALCFATQAFGYAPDEKAFTQSEWVNALRSKALALARKYEADEKWAEALAY